VLTTVTTHSDSNLQFRFLAYMRSPILTNVLLQEQEIGLSADHLSVYGMSNLRLLFFEAFYIGVVGHTLHEVFVLREGRFARIPDIVVWPCKSMH